MNSVLCRQLFSMKNFQFRIQCCAVHLFIYPVYRNQLESKKEFGLGTTSICCHKIYIFNFILSSVHSDSLHFDPVQFIRQKRKFNWFSVINFLLTLNLFWIKEKGKNRDSFLTSSTFPQEISCPTNFFLLRITWTEP